MVQKVHGKVTSGETLTGNNDFFTVYTVADLEEGDFGTTASGTQNLVRMVEAISIGAQPVMVSVSEEVVDLSVSANATKYGLGTNFNQAATTVYTFKFAIEHTGAFGAIADADDATVQGTVANILDGLQLPFTTVGVPITGPATEDVSAFDAADPASKNVAVNGFAVL